MPPTTQQTGAGAAVARFVLTGIVVLGTVGISAGAGWISWLAIRDLAVYFGWPSSTAWVVMPLIELFVLVGSAELALRVLGRDPHLAGPKALAYSALVATLGCNVADHVLQLVDGHPGAERWRVIILGAFAALVPLAQIGAIHTFTGRLMRIAAARDAAPAGPRRPSVFGRIVAAAGDRVASAIEQTPPASSSLPTSSPAAPRTRTRTGAREGAGKGRRSSSRARPVELMRAFWDQERAAGRTPSLGEMDRAAGVSYRLAKNYREKWLQEAAMDAELAQLTGGGS